VSHILIKCPRNLRPVRTGLTTDMVIFETLPLVALPLRCPACGQVHRWKPEDTWVAQVPRLVLTAWRRALRLYPHYEDVPPRRSRWFQMLEM